MGLVDTYLNAARLRQNLPIGGGFLPSAISSGPVYPADGSEWATAAGLSNAPDFAWRFDGSGVGDQTTVVGSIDFDQGNGTDITFQVEDPDLGTCIQLTDGSAGTLFATDPTAFDLGATESFLMIVVCKMIDDPGGARSIMYSNGWGLQVASGHGYRHRADPDTETLSDADHLDLATAVALRRDFNADEFEIHTALGDSGAQTVDSGVKDVTNLGTGVGAAQGPVRVAAVAIWLGTNAEEETDGAAMVAAVNAFIGI